MAEQQVLAGKVAKELQLDVLEAAARHGGVAVLAHPARRAASECFRPELARHLAGVEVWNRKYDGWAPGELASTLAITSLGLGVFAA